ncbi:MAG: DUF1028 domain-containing protein [Gaiellales bacterium]
MTFSIAAVDRATGAVGAAAATRFLAVGAGVLWAEPGVGAVCTQATTRIAYGPECLELLRAGRDPDAVVAHATAADEGSADRQLAVVDADGRGATFTGARCFDWAGGRVLGDATVQGNILIGPDVLEAMAAAWEASAGRPLEERLLAALGAGDATGGDRRGRQSAALPVRRADGADPVDLRVDDHPEPLVELERLLGEFRLVYGTTPTEQWLPITGETARRLRVALGLGPGVWDEELRAALVRRVFDDNLDGRWDGGDRLDPVVVERLLR